MGPTGRDCHYQYSQPGVARIPTATSHAGVDSFAISPAAIGRTRWCPGRYVLQVAARPDGTLGTGQGSTVYFIVR
jgi:hypothetical protein